MGKKMFHPRHSLDSLSLGDEGDPHGHLFLGDGFHDLSHIQSCGATVDTIRQLYKGTLSKDAMTDIEEALEEGLEVINMEPFGAWHLSRIGKNSGYQFKFQNNDKGLILLVKSVYTSVEKPGSHFKIEVSPHFIQSHNSQEIQKKLDQLAACFLVDAKPAGVAVHLAADFQGWTFPEDFQDRFICRSRIRWSHDGIGRTKIEEDLSSVAVTYGNTETFTVGKPTALQVCIYRKDLAISRDDKVDYFHDLWNKLTEGAFQDKQPVWRVELRFHHSVIREISQGMELETQSWLQVSKFLTDIWRYGLTRNRLDLHSDYIDPFWQLMMEDLTFQVPATGAVIKRVRKSDTEGIGRNLDLIIGNLITVFARQGFSASQAIRCFKRSGCYREILDHYKNRGLAESDLQQKVERGLALRRLIGKAA